MKFKVLSLILFIFSNSLANASDKYQMQKEIENILHAYNTKNHDALNKHIDSTFGVYIIINQNNQIYWIHRKNICLESECMSSYNLIAPYSQLLLEQTVDSQNLIIDKKNLHILTKTIRRHRLDKTIDFTSLNLQNIWEVESKSMRAVVKFDEVDNFGRDRLILYMSLLNGKWVLTMIDFS